MKIEINYNEAQEILRGIRFCEKYTFPGVADLTLIKDKLLSMKKEH